MWLIRFSSRPPDRCTKKILQRVRDLKAGISCSEKAGEHPVDRTDQALLTQVCCLDARGRQGLLNAVLTSTPIRKQKSRAPFGARLKSGPIRVALHVESEHLTDGENILIARARTDSLPGSGPCPSAAPA